MVPRSVSNEPLAEARLAPKSSGMICTCANWGASAFTPKM
jgi:hypothetical protein